MAKKSWVFLDDTVVCLGASITCTDGTAVETTVDNRNLGATGNAPSTVPWSATLTGARWAHLGGHGGYLTGTAGITRQITVRLR